MASTYTIETIPKSSTFTANLPSDPSFPTPSSSHGAPRSALGPRLVKQAFFTYVRPEWLRNAPTSQSNGVERKDENKGPGAELLGVSETAMNELGLEIGSETEEVFGEVVTGQRILGWEGVEAGQGKGKQRDEDVEGDSNGINGEKTGEGVYPWAQCYGGYQFGQWAGQLGDGRAISLFEITKPSTSTRYELQLKGAGRTPYSRFADGRAVLRSSIREFVVSEALHALGIPSTRALSLSLLRNSSVVRERTEPGAIVARFAPSWIRLGTFDLPRSRNDRELLRKLATYTGEHVLGGWESLPGKLGPGEIESASSPSSVHRGVRSTEIEGSEAHAENRFTRLFREIVRRNASTVAKWQAYGFMNGVLNTDNTSVLGLSIDFGPFAFMDDFDPAYTPNHDDFMLRYSYRNQPTVIWWNLVRLGEALGELMGAGAKVDDPDFLEKGAAGVEWTDELVERAESIIGGTGEEYKAVFMTEYKRLMTARLGLKTLKQQDFDELFSEWLDLMEAHALDFNQCFRKLGSVSLKDTVDLDARKRVAERFFHKEGSSKGENEEVAGERIAKWLQRWRERVIEDWGEGKDEERRIAMDAVNPKFIPKSWVLDELINRVEKKGERDILQGIMKMALNPFQESWGWNEKEEERFCGDVPRFSRAMQCSCSS